MIEGTVSGKLAGRRPDVLPDRPQFRWTLTRTACVFVALVLSGCGEPAPQLGEIPADGTILAFGDSLTLGVGTDRASSYPTVLAKLSGRRVINSGVSGETTAAGLDRLPDVLRETAPDVLILLEGGNDILRGRDYADIRRDLDAMLELAQRQDVPVVLIGVPEKSLFSDAAPFYAELADKYQLVYTDGLIGPLLRKPAYKSDPIHLNKQGYRALAESIHELLVSSGAL